jgi:hypothetical protein
LLFEASRLGQRLDRRQFLTGEILLQDIDPLSD